VAGAAVACSREPHSALLKKPAAAFPARLGAKMQIANTTRSLAGYPFSICGLQVIACFGTLIVLLSATGCTKTSGTVAISGRVAYQNQPLRAGALTFFPSIGRPVSASISGGDYQADLAPGEYAVIVSIAPELPAGYKEGGPPLPPPKILLPDTYTTRAKSVLKATVKSDQNQSIDFDLK
jgi:hypothetical protein